MIGVKNIVVWIFSLTFQRMTISSESVVNRALKPIAVWESPHTLDVTTSLNFSGSRVYGAAVCGNPRPSSTRFVTPSRQS